MTAAGVTLEVSPSREAEVGGLPVRRALPRAQRRTVGAWCFIDHFGPVGADLADAMQVGPHPHIGLQTVTWLLEGEVLHTDSLGS
jgi:redox-sensitive bicupin YhaK (pirin superfamily)